MPCEVQVPVLSIHPHHRIHMLMVDFQPVPSGKVLLNSPTEHFTAFKILIVYEGGTVGADAETLH
jgi:hypothetical protein